MIPDWNASDYLISAREYSVFMKALFNASYLSIKDSEYCTELLCKSDCNEGLKSGVPQNCEIAHKFGEAGTGGNLQLSESGIIYCKDKPYILTVMTNGKDFKKLPQVISDISKLINENINQIPTVKA